MDAGAKGSQGPGLCEWSRAHDDTIPASIFCASTSKKERRRTLRNIDEITSAPFIVLLSCARGSCTQRRWIYHQLSGVSYVRIKACKPMVWCQSGSLSEPPAPTRKFCAVLYKSYDHSGYFHGLLTPARSRIASHGNSRFVGCVS